MKFSKCKLYSHKFTFFYDFFFFDNVNVILTVFPKFCLFSHKASTSNSKSKTSSKVFFLVAAQILLRRFVWPRQPVTLVHHSRCTKLTVCCLHVCLSSVLRHGRVQSVHSAAVQSLHVLLSCALRLCCFRSVQLHQWVSVASSQPVQFICTAQYQQCF